MAPDRRTLGSTSQIVVVVLAACFLFAALQNVEAHKKKSHKTGSSTAAPTSAASTTGGPCPEVKPSCCLMSLLDKELDPGGFKDSSSCPLHCCNLPGSKNLKSRNLTTKGAEHKRRIVEYLKCVKKMIANLSKPDYMLPKNCCSKFITFNETKFCQGEGGTAPTVLPSTGDSTFVKPSQRPIQMTTTSPGSPSPGPANDESPTASPNQPSSSATTIAPNSNNKTRSASKRRMSMARPEGY